MLSLSLYTYKNVPFPKTSGHIFRLVLNALAHLIGYNRRNATRKKRTWSLQSRTSTNFLAPEGHVFI